jgi:pyruvate dehydrogenase E2 component (dihydrolipoamide acetyltransferase)
VISAADVEKAVQAKPVAITSTAVAHAVRERRSLTGIRKTAARRVQEAWQTIPHIVQMVDVDATALLAVRTQLKAEIPSLTLNDLILHAAAQVMAGLPDLNATVEGDTLVLYDGVDIGFAADTPRGLMVPVIRRANKLSVKELAAESQRLIEAARAGRLRLDDIGNASLTVSNLGMFGVRFGTPVINLGEPLLVFVGAVEERPVAVSSQIVIRPMMTLSIGYDHRVADGVAASQFTRGLKESLESGVPSPESQVRSTSPQHLTPSTQKRELRSTSEGSDYTVQIRSLGHEWILDEPTTDGGQDTGPDPVTAFLGALLSCMTISFKAAARRRKVAVTRIEGHVQATPQGHVKEITMSLNVWSPDAEETVRALLELAKRGCYVSGVLKPEIDFKVALTVASS